MPKLRVHNYSISLDGYAAGPNQTLDDPQGVGGMLLHGWRFQTRNFHEMQGRSGGTEGVDDAFSRAHFEGIGATIMGRNMFGPVRGEWPDESWTGWWGEDPPYHHDVFVLTHHPRPSFSLAGGNNFHFVSDPIEVVLTRAFEAAGGQDVAIGGGASTVRQFLRARLIDELHVAIAPVFLTAGERLFDDLDGALADYECELVVGDGGVSHARITRRS